MGPECLDRLYHPKMEYYRSVYENSERWNGAEPLEGKTVIVYCEQGLGDTLQFARYVPELKRRCAKVIMHCPLPLHRLFQNSAPGLEGVEFIDKNDPDLPPHDYHVLSLSLPFVLLTIDSPDSYLVVENKKDVGHEGFIKIGIAWEGNPDHSNADTRNCPLRHFSCLQTDRTKLFMIQDRVHLPTLLDGAEDMELYGSEINDFQDTAELVAAMDYVVSVDTSAMHLSASMGKKTFGLLSFVCDPRWEAMSWYDDLVLVRQNKENDWKGVFTQLTSLLQANKLL